LNRVGYENPGGQALSYLKKTHTGKLKKTHKHTVSFSISVCVCVQDSVPVRVESVSEEISSTVRYEAVSLHLAAEQVRKWVGVMR
jgi:hypothetical protein